MAFGGSSDSVEGLVKSIKKHAKFRQLASYSVKCLQQVITPPHVGWERNLALAFEAKAADAIIEVFSRHTSDESVSEASMECLGAMAQNPRYSNELVDKGLVGVVCKSFKDNPDGAQTDELAELLVRLSTNSPEKVLASGALDDLVEVVTTRKDTHPEIVAAASHAIERIARATGGAEAVVKSGAVQALLEVAKDEKYEARPEAVENALRLVERLGRSEEHSAFIRDECKGMEVLADALEVQKNNERVVKMGGRALSRLAAGNVETLVAQMKAGSESVAQKEFLASMVATLATEQDAVEKIVKADGIRAIIKTMKGTSDSARCIGACSRAISSILDDANTVEEVADAGAIRALVEAVNAHKEDEDVVTAVANALRNFCIAAGAKGVPALSSARAPETIVAALNDNMGVAEPCRAGLTFLEHLALIGYDLHPLISSNKLIETVCSVMVADAEEDEDDEIPDARLQLEGTRLLIYSCTSARQMTALVYQTGILDVILNNVAAADEWARRRAKAAKKGGSGGGGGGGASAGGGEAGAGAGAGGDEEGGGAAVTAAAETAADAVALEALPAASIYLVTSICTDRANVDSLRGAHKGTGISKKLLPAVARFGSDPTMRESFQELLLAISDADEVARTINDIEELVEAAVKPGGMSTERDAKCRELEDVVRALAALVVLPQNAAAVSEPSVIEKISGYVAKVGLARGNPKLEGATTAFTTLVSSLLQSTGSSDRAAEVWEAMKDCKLQRNVITAAKLHPKFRENVAAVMPLIESFARKDASLVAANGGIDACVAAMRINQSDKTLVSSVARTLNQLAATDDGALAVARNGGSRQIIATIQANESTSDFEEPMELMLSVLNRVASTGDGVETLRKQGAVEAIVTARSAVSPSSAAAKATTQVVSQLMGRQDMTKAVDELGSSLESLRKVDSKKGGEKLRGRGGVKATDLKPVLTRVAMISSVGTNAEEMVRKDADRNLSELAAMVSRGYTEAREAGNEEEARQFEEMLPAAIEAISSMAQVTDFGRAVEETCGTLATALTAGTSVEESLGAVCAIARSEANASMIATADSGRLLESVVSTLELRGREQAVATAAFSALSAVAKYDSSSAAVTKSGKVQRIVSDWIEDNIDDATPEALESAVSVLSSIATTKAGANTLSDDAVVDIGKSVLNKAVIDAASSGAKINTGALASTAALFANMTDHGGESMINKLHTSGALRRVIRSVASSAETLQDAEAMENVLKILGKAATVADVADDLLNNGMEDLVFAAMSANGGSDAVLAAGGEALRVLGTDANISKQCEKVSAATKALSEAEVFDEEMVTSLSSTVDRLGNLIMKDEVDESVATSVLTSVMDAVAVMDQSGLASEEQISRGLQAISRVATLQPDAEEGMSDAVDVVFDCLTAPENSLKPALLVSAISCLGQLANNKAALSEMLGMEEGVVAEIRRVAADNAGNAEMQKAVEATLDALASKAEGDMSAMATTDTGRDFLANLIVASSADMGRLQGIIEKVSSAPGGEIAILSALATEQGIEEGSDAVSFASSSEMGSDGKPILIAESEEASSMNSASIKMLRALSDKIDADPSIRFSGGVINGAAMAHTLAATVGIRAKISDDSTEEEQREAVDLSNRALVVLNGVDFDGAAANAFAKGRGLENVLQILEADLEDVSEAGMLCSIIGSVVGAPGAKQAATLLANRDDMELVISAAQSHPESRHIAYGVARAARGVVDAMGAHKAGISRDANEALRAISRKWASDAAIKAEFDRVFRVLDTRFSGTVQSEVASSLAEAVDAISMADDIVMSDGGFSSASGRVDAGTAKARFEDMTAKMESVAKLVGKQSADNIIRYDHGTVESIVKAMSSNAHVTEVTRHGASILSVIASNEDNANAIAETGGIEAVMKAVAAQDANVDVVRDLVTLLERLSRVDKYKPSIVDSGGVETLVGILTGPHVKDAGVSDKALATLANLAYENEENTNRIVSGGGVPGIEKAMQEHRYEARVLENAMCTLSNLAFANEDNCEVIGQTCGDEIAQVIFDFRSDKQTSKMALRALGNVATIDSNVVFVVTEHEAVQKIMGAMESNKDDEELLTLGIEVLGNFAVVDHVIPGEDGVEEDIPETLRLRMHTDGASDAVISAMKAMPLATGVQTAALYTLMLLLVDPVVRDQMEINDDIVPLMLSAMRNHEWDPTVQSHAGMLVQQLPEKLVEEFVAGDGARYLAQALESHGESEELVRHVCGAIETLARHNSDPRSSLSGKFTLSFTSVDLPTAVLGILDGAVRAVAAKSAEVLAILAVLRFLVMTDELVVPVAEVGVFVLTSCFDRFDDDEVRSEVARVVALIARNRETHPLIAQADVARIFTDALMRIGPDRYGRDMDKKAACLKLAHSVFNAFFFLCDGDLFKALSKEATAADAVELVLDEFKEPEEREADDPIFRTFYNGTASTITEQLEKDALNLKDMEWLASSDLAPDDGGPDKSFHARLAEEVARAEESENDVALEKWAEVEEAWNSAVARAQLVHSLQDEGRRVISLVAALDGMANAADVASKALSRQRIAKREETAADPLAPIRHALSSGKEMRKWDKGGFLGPSSEAVDISLNESLEHLSWSQKGRKLGSIPVASVQRIEYGKNPKYHGRGSDASLSFTLMGSSGVLIALEAPRKGAYDIFLSNFKALLRHRGIAVDDDESDGAGAGTA